MITSLNLLKAILPLTNFDWHMRGADMVISARRGDFRKLQTLYRLLGTNFKAMLWGNASSENPSISILGVA